MYILYLLLAVAVLLIMVLIHEFGHYTIGRMLNFKITEFSVGFGKAIFSRKNKRGELISLRIFPLGGYCAFAGEDETNENNKDAFTNQKPWKRILVFLAGVTFNFATAVIFSLILLCAIGYDIPQVTKIYDSTAFETELSVKNIIGDPISISIPTDQQLQVGDVIISLDGKKIDFAYGYTYNDILTEYVSQLNEENFSQLAVVEGIVKRDGEYKNIKVSFYQVCVQKTDKDGKVIDGESEYKYVWNVGATAYVHSFIEGLERSVPFAFGLAFVVLKSFWLLITFQLPLSDIGGPITTITTIASITSANWANLLVLIPLISANLAVFNILPIPALDGAHVMFTAIESIRKKPIKRETENMIHSIGLIVLFGAVILIDILHFLL